jgi:Mn-containing catalase
MMRKNEGSTLVMVVLLFAVLSIFSVFILSFMQTENKQSLNYVFKTQAYLAAVSGAETVEEALVRQLNSYGENSVEQQKFLEIYASPGKVIELNIPGVNEVKVTYTDINGKKVLTIESEGEVREVKEVVQKVLYSVENIVTSSNNGHDLDAKNATLGGIEAHVLTGLTPILANASGYLWTGAYVNETGDIAADLLSNIAAEQRAKVVYEYLYRQIDDKGVKDTIDFLLNREEAHNTMFREAFNKIKDTASNRDWGVTADSKLYFDLSTPGTNRFSAQNAQPPSFSAPNPRK